MGKSNPLWIERLPPLVGASPRQIQYADDVRRRLLLRTAAYVESQPAGSARRLAMASLCGLVIEQVAAWWIRNRKLCPAKLLEYHAAKVRGLRRLDFL